MTTEIKKRGALNGATMYLSSPIQFENNTWKELRAKVVETLDKKFGVKAYDPSVDEKQKQALYLEKAIEQDDWEKAEDIASKFVKKDLAIVDRSDFLVAFNPYKVPTTGTPCEVHHAVQLKKPVFIVCPEGKKKASRWYFGYIRHRYIFGSWEELYDYLEGVDCYKEMDNHRWWVVYKMV